MEVFDVQTAVMSLEIRPQAALYPPPPIQKMCFIGLLSALSDRRGRYAHAYGICAPFYQSKKIYEGGYNAARGLISRDIAEKT